MTCTCHFNKQSIGSIGLYFSQVTELMTSEYWAFMIKVGHGVLFNNDHILGRMEYIFPSHSCRKVSKTPLYLFLYHKLKNLPIPANHIFWNVFLNQGDSVLLLCPSNDSVYYWLFWWAEYIFKKKFRHQIHHIYIVQRKNYGM